MNTLTRFVLAALVVAASLQDVAAVQPRSLSERRSEMRDRLLQAKAAKLAALEQKERDFYSGKRRKRDIRRSGTQSRRLVLCAGRNTGLALLHDAARHPKGARVHRRGAQLLAAALLRRVAAWRNVNLEVGEMHEANHLSVYAPYIATPTRTFRDGFIVADRAERRAETTSDPDASIAATTDCANKTTIPIDGPPAMVRKNAEAGTEKAAFPPAVTPMVAVPVDGDDDAHTTTIKMEDGDEITIKRAANSKNKITTISTHEDGKITIENREKKKSTPASATTATPSNASPTHPDKKQDAPEDRDAMKVDASLPVEEQVAAKTRAVDFVEVYEAEEKDEDADYGEAGAEATKTAEEQKTREEEEEDTHEVVVGKKKVTFVQVGRTLTKVSLSNVDDEEQKHPSSSAR